MAAGATGLSPASTGWRRVAGRVNVKADDLIKLVVNEGQLIGWDAYAGVDDFEVHEGLFMQTA